MASKKKVRTASVAGMKFRDPRSGRFIKATVGAVRKVAREIGKMYRKAASDRNKWARARYRGAKRPETLAKYTKQYRKAMKRAADLAPKLARAQQQVSAMESKSSRIRLPKVMEVGVDYSAVRGSGSDVNFNIRVARTDGGGISESDVMRAVTAIAEGEKSLPPDLRITGVSWGRPSRQRGENFRIRHGSAEDAWSFGDILSEVVINRKGDGLRVGHIKPDEL